jgi:hypothetical protein
MRFCNFLTQAQAKTIALGPLDASMGFAQVPVKPLKNAVVYAF